MAIELGAAYISFLPTTDKIAPGVKKAISEVQKDVTAAGKTMGDSLSKGVSKGAQDSAKNIKTGLTGAQKDADKAGKAMGTGISNGVKTGADSAGKAIKGTLNGAESQSKAAGKAIGKNLSAGIADGTNRPGMFSSLGRQAVSAGRNMGTSMGTGIKNGITRIAPTVATGLTAALAGAGGLGLFGVKTAAGFEQTSIAFETLLKSSNRAKAEMAWLKDKSAATPFELKDLADADKTLLNFGFTSDNVRQQFMLDMGNIAAAVGLPGNRLPDLAKVFGQVKAAGVTSLEDINQLIDAGVPVWDALTKKTGKSVKQLRKDISDGKVDSDTFLSALQQYSKANFGTAMEKQGKSIAGMWSSITDAFSLGAAKLVTPLLPFIADIMPKVSVAMSTVGDKVALLIPKAINLAKSFKDNVLPGIVTVATTVKNDLLPPLAAVGGFIVTHLPIFATLGGIVFGIAGAFKALSIATAVLNAVMDANPIVLIAIALAALVVGVIYAYNHFEGFRKVVDTVFAAIGAAISFAWNNVIKPVFAALSWFVTTVIGPVIAWLWNGIVKPYFGFMAAYITFWWTRILYPILQFWGWVIMHVVVPPLLFLWNNVVRPVFGFIGGYIKDMWNGTIKPVFSALGTFIQKYAAPAFQKGVNAIGAIWEGLKGMIVSPLNFIIGTVYNNGLRKLINLLPGVTDVPPMGLIGASSPAKATASGGGVKNQANRGRNLGFAAGGPVTGGTKGKDSVRALLMPGEHVWTADEVKAAGGQSAMFALRKAVGRGGLAKSFDPPAFAGGGALSADQIKRAQDFAKSQVGDPYVWGGVGPNGFDCSGFMSAITNVIQSKNPYSRVGATGSFPWSGFSKGPGQFTIGSTNNYGGSGIGHMAGTVGGMNVESRGGQGVVIGNAARGYKDSGFNTVAHLGNSDTSGSVFTAITGVLKGLTGWVSELSRMGGFGGMMSQMVTNVVGSIKTYAESKAKSALSLGIFDNGGVLQPGQLAFNASNKPEAVFNHKQFAQYADNKTSTPTRMELVLENGERLSGYVRTIAGEEIDGAADYAASGNRRNR